MFYILMASYFIFLRFIWWFFIIARIHAYKFKNFSHNVEKNTNILTIVLVILTVLWFVFIFNFKTDSLIKIDETKQVEEFFPY